MTLVFVPQAAFVAVVPMRADRRRARVWVAGLIEVTGILPRATLTSTGVLDEAVRVLRQRVRPLLMTDPLTSTSVKRSILPPTSPLAFSPVHRWVGPTAVMVKEPVEPLGGIQLPSTCQGLPPEKLSAGESFVFAVRLIEGNRSRVKVGGFVVPPLPCR